MGGLENVFKKIIFLMLSSRCCKIIVVQKLYSPYWKFDEFNLASWSDEECRTELRFAKSDLELLLNYLQIPEKIVCVQGSICNGMESLCIPLKRLAYPCTVGTLMWPLALKIIQVHCV